jgi:hypothetical protein
MVILLCMNFRFYQCRASPTWGWFCRVWVPFLLNIDNRYMALAQDLDLFIVLFTWLFFNLNQ